jgi:diguanylate cyclase (GGDEF)-like protein
MPEHAFTPGQTPLTISLKTKLVTATIASVSTIAVLVFVLDYGANAFSAVVAQSRMITTAVRNHTNADMMHDALRADVFAALQFARTAPERQAEIIAETSEHAAEMKRLMDANKAFPLPDDVKVRQEPLQKQLDVYSAAAMSLVATAFEDPHTAELQLGNFERQFAVLETAMEVQGDALEFAAANESDGATMSSEKAVWISEAALVIGLIIGALALWITYFDVVSPLTTLTSALKKAAAGEHQIVVSASRRDEIGQMGRALEKFGRDATERNRLSHETRVLSELNEWLQSAKSEAELYQMIAEFLSRFIPDCAGTIYIYANSRDILECVKVWNGSQSAAPMHPDDCWGLRRGRTYTHGQNEVEFDCPHVLPGVASDYCCIPILAHGETVGSLHLEYRPKNGAGSAKDAFVEQRRLGLAAVEHISLAIANVRLRDQLRDQSIRDTLTGLYNRRYMLETCRREFQRAARASQPVSMLSIDVDHFKTFNDNHGHDAGDSVLRAVGEALNSTFRGDDVPCRFGGEEFVVLLPNTSLSAAQQRAEELRTKVERLSVRYANNNLPRITISVGVAAYPEFGGAPMEVLNVADTALYSAKRSGRNRVELPQNSQTFADDAKSPSEKLSNAILDRLAQHAATG